MVTETHLHHQQRDADVLGQPDGSAEVSGQRHQQVQDGHQVLCVDTCNKVYFLDFGVYCLGNYKVHIQTPLSQLHLAGSRFKPVTS